MTNLDVPATSSVMSAEKHWEEKYKKENKYYPNEGLGDLDLSETATIQDDPVHEEKPLTNQAHRSIPPRKTSPKEKLSFSSHNKKFDNAELMKKEPCFKGDKHIFSKGDTKSSSPEHDEPNKDDFFKSSQHSSKYSRSLEKGSETVSTSLPYTTETNSNILHRANVKYPNNVPVDVVVEKFNSSLQFRDTQGCSEAKSESTILNSTVAKKYESGSSKLKNFEKKSNDPCEPSETDILLHSFIRHEPPSNINHTSQSNLSDGSSVKKSDSNLFFSPSISPSITSQNLNLAQDFISPKMPITEQHPALNGVIGNALPIGIQSSTEQDSGSSISGSPLQNITPFGSLEKEIPPAVRSAVQLPTHTGNIAYSYPYSLDNESLARHLLLANQNMTSALNKDYSSPSAPIRGMLPVHSIEGIPQYQYMNSNMMVPSFTGQISPLLYQQQLQQAQLQYFQILALNNAQLQHTQLSTDIVDTDGNTRNEQVINQSQVQNSNNLPAQTPQMQILPQVPQAHILSQASHILSQAQAQVLSQNKPQIFSQNQPNLLHLQNHPQIATMQHQQSVTSMETPSSKREDLLKQHTLPAGRSQNSGKTSEELQLEYQNAILALRRVQEEMQESQVQTSVPGAQAQPSWGVVSPTMSMAVNQLFPIGMVPQVNPHLIQQSQNTGVMAPNVYHGSPNLPAAVNMDPVINLDSEINTAEEPAKTLIGRGRGRIV